MGTNEGSEVVLIIDIANKNLDFIINKKMYVYQTIFFSSSRHFSSSLRISKFGFRVVWRIETAIAWMRGFSINRSSTVQTVEVVTLKLKGRSKCFLFRVCNGLSF